MQIYLGLLLFSLVTTGILMIPYIGFLYSLGFRRKKEMEDVYESDTQAFKDFRARHATKVGTPTGGGILVVVVVAIMFVVFFDFIKFTDASLISGFELRKELAVLWLTFVGFGLLGLYDDVLKVFGFTKTGFFGLRFRHKFVIQWAIGIVIAVLMHLWLGIDLINIPGIAYWHIGWWYVPLCAFLIVAFANAFDITDGLDGLSCGLLMLCLLAFWMIAATNLDRVLSLFISLWLGSLMAFLYFNIHPARIMLGNAGGLAFGATLAVVGLLSGKIIVLMVVAGLFIVDGGSSLVQILSRKIFKRRVFPIAPIHHWLEHIGWEEPKIVARAWLAGLMLAIFGLWLAWL